MLMQFRMQERACCQTDNVAVSCFHVGIRKDNMTVFLRGAALKASQNWLCSFPCSFQPDGWNTFKKLELCGWGYLKSGNVEYSLWIWELRCMFLWWEPVGANCAWSCGVAGHSWDILKSRTGENQVLPFFVWMLPWLQEREPEECLLTPHCQTNRDVHSTPITNH